MSDPLIYAKIPLMEHQILLFYKYIDIENPEEVMKQQKELCSRLGIKCRTIVAHEGINGTLEGTKEATEEYINEMSKDQRFADIHWKRSVGTGDAFPKVSVKVRDEIVSLKLGEKDVDPNQTTGKYITAQELHELYESGEEFYVVDMRNDYEQRVGHFKDAILMPMKNFRELPDTLKEIEHLKDKKVVTTCTGGIRCEKASGFLVDNGFTDVYQLYGGMQTYIEKYPNQNFLGKMYVFDGRMIWGMNTDSPEHEVISVCDLCGDRSDDYTDCSYKHCEGMRHFIACDRCRAEDGAVYCREECKTQDIKLKESSDDK